MAEFQNIIAETAKISLSLLPKLFSFMWSEEESLEFDIRVYAMGTDWTYQMVTPK